MGSPEALGLYERSLTLRPNYTTAHIRYGQALLQAKRYEEAAKEFRAALQADPTSSHAYLGLALITLTQGNVQEARGILLKALEVNPRHGEVHGLLSEVYRRLNMPEESRQELLISQALPKKTPLTDEVGYQMIDEGVSSYWYELRGRGYLERGSYEAAVHELKLAVQAVDDPTLHDTLGAAYLYLRKYPEAAKEHRAALALNPKSVVSMNNLASALFEMGQVNEAMLWVKKAIEVQPNFAASYAQLGRLSLRLGNRAEAIRAFRRGLEKVPGDPELSLRLAWQLATASDASFRNGADAIQLAELVCKKSNYQNPDSLDVRAAAYAERGETAKAAKLAERAYQIATASRQMQLAKRIQAHLNFYQAGSAYRE
jgi:Tfp pilus assembly protein PilF